MADNKGFSGGQNGRQGEDVPIPGCRLHMMRSGAYMLSVNHDHL